MKEPKENEFGWVFFAVSAKPTSLRRAIAERISQSEKVILIDLPVSVRQERAIPALRMRTFPLQGNKNIIHYHPLHFPEKLPGVGGIFRVLNEKWIQREIDQLLPPRMGRIVCYDSPTQYPLVKKFRERLSVYLAVDDRTLTVWGDPIFGEAEAERRLLGKVNQVICVSEPLAQTLKSRIPEGRTPPILVLPNGYDERIFNSSMDYPEPGFLKDIPRPRILIAGHISERIDWDGIAAASRLRPDWTWIFLGPADRGMEEKLRSLLDSRGVLHPSVPVVSVPAWIRHSDACAVPYRLNLFTRASSPLKAYEYLAMGTPTLATRIPSLERFGDSLYWVMERDGKSYAEGLDQIGRKRQKKPRPGGTFRLQSETLGRRVEAFRKWVTLPLAA